MAANRSKRHRHKYHLVSLGAGKVWACALPDCTHYMPSHMNAMVEGKASICWQCGEDMILDKANMKENQPRCESCRLGIETVAVPLSNAMADRLKSNDTPTPRVTISEEAILNFLK